MEELSLLSLLSMSDNRLTTCHIALQVNGDV